ncbi:unnamed protein product, partial [marine sediment metagenome]
GWDADCTAATAGTIIGVTRGYRWMMAQGWQIVDRYANTTRQDMPEDETITSFADRLGELAERVIIEQGGQRVIVNGKPVYRICQEKPVSIEPLPNLADQAISMRSEMKSEIETAIVQESTVEEKARAAYLAICLDLAKPFRGKYPGQWSKCLAALNDYWKLVQVLYHHSPVPAGDKLRAKAAAAGLKKPAKKKDLW